MFRRRLATTAFKRIENNFDVASSTEIIYKNVQAIRNRMKLLENFRLMRKDKLDYETLREMRKEFVKPNSILCFSSKSIHRVGDIDIEQDATVKLTFDPKKLNLNAAQMHKLLLLAGEYYSNSNGLVCVECGRFPFKEQNKKWLEEAFVKLVNEVKNGADYFADLDNIFIKPVKKKPEFPEEWLKNG